MATTKGSTSVREAGQRGGNKRKQELGHQGYQELGKRGGSAAHKKNPGLASRAGRAGGQTVSRSTGKAKSK